jgi:aspartate kinase
METIVQKYGGSSLQNRERLEHVTTKIIASINSGFRVLTVVSAMGSTTQQLIDLSRTVTDHPPPRELDMLLTTGEQVSASLLCMVLAEKGVKCRSLNAFQAGIITDNSHNRARIQTISKDRLQKWLKEYEVLVVTGFQGITDHGDLTTLGRGGSDTTAVALAAALGTSCEIYSDVPGIFTVDPRRYPSARKLDRIGYDEMLEMARQGSKVLHDRSVEIAKKFKVPLTCASSFSDEEGSRVIEDIDLEHSMPVTGLSLLDHQWLVKVVAKNITAMNDIRQVFQDLELNIDMIALFHHNDELLASFTVWEEDWEKAGKKLELIKEKLNNIQMTVANNFTKITLVGSHMRTSVGVASTIFKVLPPDRIYLITTSEISISLLVCSEESDDMVKALAKEFNL